MQEFAACFRTAHDGNIRVAEASATAALFGRSRGCRVTTAPSGNELSAKRRMMRADASSYRCGWCRPSSARWLLRRKGGGASARTHGGQHSDKIHSVEIVVDGSNMGFTREAVAGIFQGAANGIWVVPPAQLQRCSRTSKGRPATASTNGTKPPKLPSTPSRKRLRPSRASSPKLRIAKWRREHSAG